MFFSSVFSVLMLFLYCLTENRLNKVPTLWSEQAFSEGRDKNLINVSLDSNLSLYKSPLFFATTNWPYLLPVGPSGRFICFCARPPTQVTQVRPVTQVPPTEPPPTEPPPTEPPPTEPPPTEPPPTEPPPTDAPTDAPTEAPQSAVQHTEGAEESETEQVEISSESPVGAPIDWATTTTTTSTTVKPRLTTTKQKTIATKKADINRKAINKIVGNNNNNNRNKLSNVKTFHTISRNSSLKQNTGNREKNIIGVNKPLNKSLSNSSHSVCDKLSQTQYKKSNTSRGLTKGTIRRRTHLIKSGRNNTSDGKKTNPLNLRTVERKQQFESLTLNNKRVKKTRPRIRNVTHPF